MTNHSSVENLPIVTYSSFPVITTESLAQVYGTEAIRIQQNYKRNDDRFIAGKHFFKLEGPELKAFKNRLSLSESVGKRARSLVLWTERGAARHAKMLETDQAWEVFERLEDFYFNQKENAPKPRKPKALPKGLSIEQQQSIKGLVMGRAANVPDDLRSKAILRCWSALKTHFKMSYKEIAPELFTEAVSLISILPLEGELLPNEVAAPAAPLHIHFPAETASPHDRKFGNDWFTARTILDERNRAPEQELLVLLEASGFDVTGASIRIHAMYGIIKQFLGVQRELAIASHHSST
ncbi:MAG: ORF6N domain-containing protein, partial [Aeromonas sp.]